MSCCGKKREELRQRHIVTVLPVATQSPSLLARSRVHFLGSGSYLVAGEHSQEVYRFTQEQPEQPVDERDLSGLLKTGLFQVKGRH
jgi:hypothetical protein